VRKKFLIVLVLIVLGIVASVAVVHVQMERFQRPTVALWDRVELGASESSVRALLGTPFREFTSASAPERYYISGFGFKERAISGKVLIYSGADMVNYIWISEHGAVEDMYRAGS